MSCKWCQPQSIISSAVFMYLVKPPNLRRPFVFDDAEL
jgi:hypothetical protein